jgi:hypothetical protein
MLRDFGTWKLGGLDAQTRKLGQSNAQMLRASDWETQMPLVDSETQMLRDTDAQGYVHSEAQMPRLGDLDALEIWRLRDSETHTLGSLDLGTRMLGGSQTLRHSEAQTWILGSSEAWRLRGSEAQKLSAQTQRLRGSEAQRLRSSVLRLRHLELRKLRLAQAQMLSTQLLIT